MDLNNPDGIANLKEFSSQLAQNLLEDKDNPIILVPGFSGWGTPLFGSINYWGRIENIPKLLMDKGYSVIERACELYRQLTIGRLSVFDPATQEIEEQHDVDINYGNYFTLDPANSPTTLITQGRKRAILYSQSPERFIQWVWSKENPAHFICHSQGGNTVRYLISLMTQGSGGQHPEYFSEVKRGNWVISVTTLGTPHKGTTITDVIENFMLGSRDQLIKLLARLFATFSFNNPAQRSYDLQLDHWGICRQGNETFQEMRQRLESIPGPVSKWYNSQNNAFYDNSIKGVNMLHMKASPLSEDTYYFSLAFHSTVPFPSTWPPWTVEAAEGVLHSIPVVNIGAWVVDRILDAIGHIVGWAIILPLLNVRDVVRWVTRDVLNRLLRDTNYQVQLPLPGKYLPRKDVIPLMVPTVYAMGGQDLMSEQIDTLGPDLGDWYLNNGIVNTNSMRGPDDSIVRDIAAFPISDVNSYGARGLYWHFGTNSVMDHADEIGIFIKENTVCSLFYAKQKRQNPAG
ncbi:hypothetical protein BDW60DRAFT_220859 [Aspergillus nidulans var. acristatus]